MPEITIKPDDLDYTTFAMALSRLSESDQAMAIARVKQLLQHRRAKGQRSVNSEADEETSFRADIASQVLQELVGAGKLKFTNSEGQVEFRSANFSHLGRRGQKTSKV